MKKIYLLIFLFILNFRPGIAQDEEHQWQNVNIELRDISVTNWEEDGAYKMVDLREPLILDFIIEDGDSKDFLISEILDNISLYVYNDIEIGRSNPYILRNKLIVSEKMVEKNDLKISINLNEAIKKFLFENRKFGPQGENKVYFTLQLLSKNNALLKEYRIEVVDSLLNSIKRRFEETGELRPFFREENGAIKNISFSNIRNELRGYKYNLEYPDQLDQGINYELNIPTLSLSKLPPSTDLAIQKSPIEKKDNQFILEVQIFFEDLPIYRNTTTVVVGSGKQEARSANFEIYKEDFKTFTQGNFIGDPESIIKIRLINTDIYKNPEDIIFNVFMWPEDSFSVPVDIPNNFIDSNSDNFLGQVKPEVEGDILLYNINLQELNQESGANQKLWEHLKCGQMVDLIIVMTKNDEKFQRNFSEGAFRIELADSKVFQLKEDLNKLFQIQINRGSSFEKLDTSEYSNFIVNTGALIRIPNASINGGLNNLAELLRSNQIKLISNEQDISDDIGKDISSLFNESEGEMNIHFENLDGCRLLSYKISYVKSSLTDLGLVAVVDDEIESTSGFDSDEPEAEKKRSAFPFESSVRIYKVIDNNNVEEIINLPFHSIKLSMNRKPKLNEWVELDIPANNYEDFKRWINSKLERVPWALYKLELVRNSDGKPEKVAFFRFTEEPGFSMDKITPSLTYLSGNFDSSGANLTAGTFFHYQLKITSLDPNWRLFWDVFFQPGLEVQVPHLVSREREAENGTEKEPTVQIFGVGGNISLGLGLLTVSGGYTFGEVNKPYWALGLNPLKFADALILMIEGEKYEK